MSIRPEPSTGKPKFLNCVATDGIVAHTAPDDASMQVRGSSLSESIALLRLSKL